MTVLRPTAIDAAPLAAGTKWRTAGSGFLGPRGMRTCSQGKKVAYGRCGQGDRDEGVLRSHQINRGLRGCGLSEPDRPRHAARPIVELTTSTPLAQSFRDHAHTTSRLQTCSSLRRHRRWVRLHYRLFDSRAIFDWMVSPPNRQGLGYAAIALALSAPHPNGWSAWNMSPASGTDWAGVFHGRVPPYGGASSAPNGADPSPQRQKAALDATHAFAFDGPEIELAMIGGRRQVGFVKRNT